MPSLAHAIRLMTPLYTDCDYNLKFYSEDLDNEIELD